MQSFSWHQVAEQPGLVQYRSGMLGEAAAPAERPPVLFVNPMPPETVSPLAAQYHADGFTAVYSYHATAEDDAAVQALAAVVAWLLAQHPAYSRLIMIGCVGGGALARRYLLLGGEPYVAFLFMLGSAHRFSQLAYLPEAVFSPGEAVDPLPLRLDGSVSTLNKPVQVNLYSDLAVIPTPLLEDAVNAALPVGEEALCRDVVTYRAMRRYLQGAWWVVTVQLASLLMRGPESETRTGPFCFEVNGVRAPFTGVFRLPLNTRFDFDPAQTPLSTVKFPLTAAGRAVDIEFRLKNLSRRGAQRRKLSTTLHTPLREDLLSEHVLQDSLGSELGIYLSCCRPTPVLDPDDTNG